MWVVHTGVHRRLGVFIKLQNGSGWKRLLHLEGKNRTKTTGKYWWIKGIYKRRKQRRENPEKGRLGPTWCYSRLVGGLQRGGCILGYSILDWALYWTLTHIPHSWKWWGRKTRMSFSLCLDWAHVLGTGTGSPWKSSQNQTCQSSRGFWTSLSDTWRDFWGFLCRVRSWPCGSLPIQDIL